MRTCAPFLLLAIALPLLALEHAAPGFTLNRVAIGASKAQLVAAVPGVECEPVTMHAAQGDADEVCDVPAGALDEPLLASSGAELSFHLRGGVVNGASVFVDAAGLRELAAHFDARYGAPRTVESAVAERRGESGDALRWDIGRVGVIADLVPTSVGLFVIAVVPRVPATRAGLSI